MRRKEGSRGISRAEREKALREQYAKDNSGGGGTYYLIDSDKLKDMGVEKYTALEGKNFLVIMPQPNDPIFYRKIGVHYGVGGTKNAYICGSTIGKKCPVCDRYAEMKGAGEADEVLNDLKTKYRYLFFVVDVKDRAGRMKGVRLFDAAYTIYNETMKQAEDDRSGAIKDISDPDVRRNIVFTREGTGKFNTNYIGFKLERTRKPLVSKLYSEVPEFDEVILQPDFKAMKADLEGFELPEEEEFEEEKMEMEEYDDEEEDEDFEEDDAESEDDDSDEEDEVEYDDEDLEEDEDDDDEEDDPPVRRKKKANVRKVSRNPKRVSKNNVRKAVKKRRRP